MNPDGTQDINAISLDRYASHQSKVYDTIDGSSGTAGLKITDHAIDLDVSADCIIGGSENCVDVNNEARSLTIYSGRYEVRGKYAISLKTSHDVVVGGHIVGRARDWEINLGSWSDQSKAVQSCTYLDLTADHYPIRVWVGNADIPFMDEPEKYRLMGFGRHGKLVRRVCMFSWGLGKRLRIPGV